MGDYKGGKEKLKNLDRNQQTVRELKFMGNRVLWGEEGERGGSSGEKRGEGSEKKCTGEFVRTSWDLT